MTKQAPLLDFLSVPATGAQAQIRGQLNEFTSKLQPN